MNNINNMKYLSDELYDIKSQVYTNKCLSTSVLSNLILQILRKKAIDRSIFGSLFEDNAHFIMFAEGRSVVGKLIKTSPRMSV
jgi:hypothetical protein